MDESSRVVTFKKSLEIEDLEILMNQEQYEDTIPLQREENWEIKYVKNKGHLYMVEASLNLNT